MLIHGPSGQRWTSTHTAEPVYLQFSNTDACNNWFALLRSYAIPEIYGRWFFPGDGGSYRMWRQVELTIFQGRNLGNARPLEASSEPNSEIDGLDLGVSCEIHLNDISCGRTTVKKGLGSPDWHESFTFSDLPPFETVDLLVWQEKKSFRSELLGSVRIPLINFRRGEAIEGWFPVVHGGSIAGDIQVGELRLKMRIDELVSPYFNCIPLIYPTERLFSPIRHTLGFSRLFIFIITYCSPTINGSPGIQLPQFFGLDARLRNQIEVKDHLHTIDVHRRRGKFLN